MVVNFRGCAGVPLTSPQFCKYTKRESESVQILMMRQPDSAGYTDDIRSAILYISARYPRASLLGIGFSLGANVLTRYVGEEGTKCRLKAACVLACVSRVEAVSPTNIDRG